MAYLAGQRWKICTYTNSTEKLFYWITNIYFYISLAGQHRASRQKWYLIERGKCSVVWIIRRGRSSCITVQSLPLTGGKSGKKLSDSKVSALPQWSIPNVGLLQSWFDRPSWPRVVFRLPVRLSFKFNPSKQSANNHFSITWEALQCCSGGQLSPNTG